MQQKLIKVISVILVTAILYANSSAVISYAADNFLSEKEIENQGTSTKSENVEFDVYYDGGKHSATADINATDTKLNIAINVKKAGYLKDAVVDFSDTNFTIAQTEESEYIQSFDAASKKVVFNQINNGVNALETINIAADKKDEINQDMFSKDNVIKLTATYVNAKAEEIAIEKEIVIHTDWNAQDAKANLQYEITKYIPYATNGVSKLITQGKVTSYVANSVLPIKETNIEIIAPMINNQYPEEVTVVPSTTNATNGDLNGEKFTTDNWTYDNATGKIIINVKNDAIDGKIKWVKNTADQYIVTYIYSSDVYDAVKDSSVRLTYNVSSRLNLYGNGVTEISAAVDGYQDQTDKLGEIVEFTTEAIASLNKGFLYNNKNATDENKKETEYTTKYTANISYADIIDSLILRQEIDQFVTDQGQEQATTIADTNYAYNKILKISKQEFDKVFGEEGQINILNNAGEILETINKDTYVDNGSIVIDLSKFNINNITIQTSKPQKEGNITFEIIKALAKNIDYSTNQIKGFVALKTSMIGNVKNADTNIVEVLKDNNISLEEPSQKVGVTTSNNRLSTIVKNENVELKVTLENDSADDMMYTNPTVKVDLPSNIENLDVKTAQLFFDDELTIKNVNVVDNDNGTKSIIASLEGTQTKYNNPAVQGATIVFTSDITLNKLTPTTNTTLEATAVNGDTDNTVATNQTDVKYVAPTGVVATNTMIGYNGEETLEAINGEAKEALIATKADQKEVTFTMNVINNYENTLDNVVVLGRTPFAGNKDVITSQNLGSTMDMPLTTGITVSGIDSSNITIYYSENGEATSDVTNASNEWKTDVSDYSKVKSYMITLNNYTMNTGASFTFSYKAMIQANLDYDKAAYENYAIYFNNNQSSGTISDKVAATKIGVTTGSIAKLDAKLTSKAGDGAKVKSGDNLEYELTINNTGSLKAENVSITIEMPDGLTYSPEDGEDYEIKYIEPVFPEIPIKPDGTDEDETEDDEDSTQEVPEYDTTVIEGKTLLIIKLKDIDPHSFVTKNLVFKTISTAQEEITVQMKATVNYGNDGAIETNTVSNILTKVYFNAKVIKTTNEYTYIKEGDMYTYKVSLKATKAGYENISVQNTIVTVTLPEELEYDSIVLEKYNTDLVGNEDISSSASVTAKENVITINIGDLDSGRGKTLTLNLKVKTLADGVYTKDIVTKATIQADNTAVENIEDVIETINKAGIKATQTCNIPEGTTISSAEDFAYSFTLENLSEIRLEDVKFVDYLPEEVQFKSLEIVYSDGTMNTSVKTNDDKSVETTLHINSKDKVIININVLAKSLDKDTEISNKAKISHELVSEFETNSISHVIKMFNKDDMNIDSGSESGSNNNKQTKKIIGTIWIDENKDGIKDASEQKVADVKVLLLDNSTGNIALDANNNECITQTSKDGAYMFNNIMPGKYSVIFLYDSSNYSPTEYKKDGVDDSQNSDAIDKTVIYEGKTQIAAVTEEIVVSDSNRYNIDLGIVEDPKFDLKLDKVVKSITVNNTKTTTEHEYNSKLAKIDFESKYAASSSMVVEYKFTITNEGGIPGYVKKLADYLPAELKFNSELNNDWYEGKDGVIYNNSLANTVINPGESKEVTLILTKNMNSEDFGLINNSAEIYETSNDYGALDVDSTPGNKSTSEDDYSTANVLTSIKTGGIIVYTTLTLTVIAIIGVGLYMIKKKVLK